MQVSPSPDLEYLPRLPQDKSIGIGCIGSGFIMADCHLVAYRNAGFNPVAIASRNRANSQAVADRHGIKTVYNTYQELLHDPKVEIVDIAVPPQLLLGIVKDAIKHAGRIKGILAQKPLGINFAEAQEIVRLCEEAGIALGVNQNMRYDQSIRACKDILDKGYLGKPVFASIDMRAIPHWMPWQKELGWATLRTMSIHHLDTFRFLFGDPQRVYASVAEDPRNAATFAHEDGIALYILEYENGFRASAWDDVWTGPAREGAESDIYIKWRVEGTEGIAKGNIGWPDYPLPVPSTLDFTTTQHAGWQRPRWKEVWFPDAFAGPMAQLMCAIEEDREPEISGKDNLKTMALVEACYRSFREHRAVAIDEILTGHNVPSIHH
ncbi:Gfo/Idh/MocA family protein [Dyadobacter aurulentus]|uniref:Gfo/Idh/MocA family protein n=1 Tax=Dyadobacter sp. UC 10 TaxID=2605428 RepID=UPI0011F14681|nr:Gfo/Idh/MocA family oxidoreductase [Dyadobacter sp. UC 10]KAA0988926.1 Gfo/Idh/MocA family oxidoreductase [Dyadobacter sp. UC 10]